MKHFITLHALALITLAAGSARGQTAPAPAGDRSTPERVVVTGSYLATAEGEGPLPVSTFTEDDLRKLGAQTPAEGLRQLPSFVGNVQTENNSNQGFGTAGVNLRGLGQRNTLVLINGMRAGNPSLGSGFQDLNAIPLSAVDRVEVLKDGASATYGSDAVAGVVNFILRQRFEGAEVRYLYGDTTNNDAGVNQASVLTGLNTANDRLHLVLDGEYYHRNALYSRDRFISSNADLTRFGGQSNGSPTYDGRITATLPGSPIPVELVTAGGPKSTVTPASVADYQPYNPRTDAYNFFRATPAIPEQELIHYYGATDYELIPKALDLYALELYSENRFYNAGAPSPGGLPALVANLSPYNPIPATADQGIQAVRFRTTDLGARLGLQDHKDYHIEIGGKGDVGSFHYDASLGHDESKLVTSFSGDVRTSLLVAQIAPAGVLNAAVFQNALGLPLAEAQNAAALNAAYGATLNPFIGAKAPRTGTLGPFAYDNAAALHRAAYSAQTAVFDNQNYADLNLSDTFLSKLPQGGFSVAVGGEYRRETHEENDDPVLLLRDAQGFAASGPYHATQDVLSAYGELNVPITSPAMNIPGLYNLAFTAAVRYQNYQLEGIDPLTIVDSKGMPAIISTGIPRFGSGRAVSPSFQSTNPKFDFRWQPIPDITVRGSYSTSFRAPSLPELFAPPVSGGSIPLLNDQGAPAGTPARVQASDTTTGNPSLKPEKTDSYSIGAVLSPRFVRGLNVTADLYQLNQKNLILSGAGVAQFYLDSNFASGGKQFANVVSRDAGGNLLGISEQPVNAARRDIEGVDVVAAYELPTVSWGKWVFTLGWNHFFRFNAALSDRSGFTDLLGRYSDSPLTPGSIPYNKGVLSAEWQWKGFDLVATANYIGDYLDQSSAVNGSVLETPIEDAANPAYTRSRKVAAYTTLDLQLSYTFRTPEAPAASSAKDGKDFRGSNENPAPPATGANWREKLLGGTTVTLGCNNLFDQEPPVSVGAFNDNYDTSLYSLRDRFIYASVARKF